MLLTPSYHVFEMYAVHQDATLVPCDVQSERYAHKEYDIPALSASASVDDDGKLHVTLSNANPHKEISVNLFVRGMKGSQVQGRVLQGSQHECAQHLRQAQRGAAHSLQRGQTQRRWP